MIFLYANIFLIGILAATSNGMWIDTPAALAADFFLGTIPEF
jgi:hypothetical protein